MQSLGERQADATLTGAPLPSPLLGTLTLFALSFVFPLLIIANTPDDGYAAWTGAALIMVIVGARFAWIVGSRDRRLFEMTTWLYFYLFLGAAPMVQLRERADPGTTPGIVHDFDGQAVAIVLAASLAIMGGSALAARRPRHTVARAPSGVHARRTTLLTLAVIAFTLFYVQRLGVGTLIQSREVRSQVTSSIFPDPTTAAIASALVTMGLLVAVVAQLAVRRARQNAGEKRPILLLTISVVMLFVVVNPVSMPRFVFGTVFLGFLAAVGIYGTARRFRLTALGAVGGLVFLFPLLDVFRRSLDATITFESPFESFLSGDYDSFAQINNAALHVAQSGSTVGQQALGVVLFWVPRSLWSGKPVDTGILLANDRGYGFTNLSAPLPAELFINGGWAVLVVGMLAFGFALRRWDTGTEIALRLRGVPSVLGCIVPFYMLIVLRGSLLQAMASLSVILAMAWFVGDKSKALASST